MRILRTFLPVAAAVALLLPVDVSAQDGPVASSLRAQFALVSGNLIAAAEQFPEELYGFRPTAEVRSFGELIGHVANAQFAICADLRGEANPSGRNLEEVTSKTELAAAMREAWEYCAPAYAEAEDGSMGETVGFFGGTQPRIYPMTFGLIHAYEHYGNLVTYMRLNDFVPPSSQGG